MEVTVVPDVQNMVSTTAAAGWTGVSWLSGACQWGRFGGILGGHGLFEWLSWEDFGAIWGVLGGSWATFGALLGGLNTFWTHKQAGHQF